ncbi:MAG: N-acetyltransferase [Gammaproteobacteria bacterium]|nr:N-acetyltransferase [Gammaproteobacteria bacterium]
MNIRSESLSDIAAIEALSEDAFKSVTHSSHTEQFIVNALRKADQLSISLVAELEGAIVGHVAMSPVSISDASQAWFGLGPISVAPEHQKKGIGSSLMKQAIAALQHLGASGCVVLGDPQYYHRFGFEVSPDLVLPGVPPEHFQALSFNLQRPKGDVSYHEAFNAQS